MKLEDINILKIIKDLYPNIEDKETNLTDLVNQIISNIKTLNPNSLKITEWQVYACIKTTVNKTLEILDNK